MVILRILLDETGSGNFKMAAAEPHVPITQVLDKVATKFQRVTHIFVVRQLNGTKPDIAQCKRKTLIQNGDRQTGSKPEVLISQLLDKIATPIQRLPHIFVVQQLNGTIADTARCNRMSVIQDGVHHTGSKPEVLISQLLDKIATPFQRLSPHFRGPTSQRHYFGYCPMQP